MKRRTDLGAPQTMPGLYRSLTSDSNLRDEVDGNITTVELFPYDIIMACWQDIVAGHRASTISFVDRWILYLDQFRAF